MTDEEANKILNVRIVDFDYKKEFGGQKGQHGVIAEEVKNVIPSVVSVPDGYDESNFDLSKGIEQPILSVAYSHFVPYLIKEVQILNDRINELEKKLNK